MSITLLRDVLLDKGKLDSYFEGNVPTDLWRAVNQKSNQTIFEFVEKGFTFSNGRPRPADIKIES